jgi:predicted site-specific integrase-resolvase
MRGCRQLRIRATSTARPNVLLPTVPRGYQVAKVVTEVGSGINDARPKLLALLADQGIGVIVVEHKDRLTRFGFR